MAKKDLEGGAGDVRPSNGANAANVGHDTDMSGNDGHDSDMSGPESCDVNELATVLKSLGGQRKSTWEFGRPVKTPSDDALRKKREREWNKRYHVNPFSTDAPDDLRKSLLAICQDSKGFALRERSDALANVERSLCLIADALEDIAEGRSTLAVVKKPPTAPKSAATVEKTTTVKKPTAEKQATTAERKPAMAEKKPATAEKKPATAEKNPIAPRARSSKRDLLDRSFRFGTQVLISMAASLGAAGGLLVVLLFVISP